MSKMAIVEISSAEGLMQSVLERESIRANVEPGNLRTMTVTMWYAVEEQRVPLCVVKVDVEIKVKVVGI